MQVPYILMNSLAYFFCPAFYTGNRLVISWLKYGKPVLFYVGETYSTPLSSVVDRHRFGADPDPTFHFDADTGPDPDPTPKLYSTWKIRFFYF
jgi:hypothetical protein